jgi:hypothetical protein
VCGASSILYLSTSETSDKTIIVIHGFPGLSLLRQLRVEFNLEPEILLEHLNLPYSFRIDPLPQALRQIFTVLMISFAIYTREEGLSQEELQAQVNLKNRRETIDSFVYDLVEKEQFRKVNLHRLNYLSIEQKVKLLPVEKDSNTCTAIVFNDSGKPIGALPWHRKDPPLRIKTKRSLKVAFGSLQ